MIGSRSLVRCRGGSTAAEFTMVLPLLLILIFGIIDGGRYMWTVNRAQKAVQVGARFAVVTNTVPSGLQEYSFVSDTNPPGSPIPASAFGSITCQESGGTATCSCTASPCSDDMVGDADTNAFEAIANRMRDIYPDLVNENVTIRYEGVGLGFAGNPHGSDVSALVTVEMTEAMFRPVTLLVFGGPQISLPAFRSSMTLEDGLGTVSN